VNRRSLRTEIVAGFATLVVALALVGGYALVRQARAVQALRLQNEGYLRLSLALAQTYAEQTVLSMLLERVVEERDPAVTRARISSALRTRRAVILRARTVADTARRDVLVPSDTEVLTRVSHGLGDVDLAYRQDDSRFAALFDALASNDPTRVQTIHQPLLAREQSTADSLRELTRDVEARMRGLAAEAEHEQPRTMRVLSIVTVFALGIGLFTLLSAWRALRPLKLLIERVREVAGGDFTRRIVPARNDEVGELAREFDNMVEAVKARDTALREKAAEIQRAERHLEQVVATLRAAVMVVGHDGVVRSANPAAVRFVEGATLIGEPFGETAFGANPDIAAAVAKTRRGDGGGLALLAAPLSNRAFDIAVAEFVTPGGEGKGALVVADDVTEREQARARLLQNERLAAIGRMAAHVTHEVRNPLSSMALNAEMLADEAGDLGDDGREVKRLVSAIQREIDRLTGITEEYLRVARLPRPRLEREDVMELLEETRVFVAAEFQRSGIDLVVKSEGAIPPVMLDESQLRQALLNILRNARELLEAQPPEKRRVTIKARARKHDEHDGVEISIADSGPGIKPEVRVHLFELFFTTKERGTGLGLPLTREIIIGHGGTIDATDADASEGGGARFVLWLPAARADRGTSDGGTLDAA
jgi:nitrogen fixation/metabolism regulation signal transduction histidine kinase